MVARWAVDLLLFLQAEVDLVTRDGGYDSAMDVDSHEFGKSVKSTESIPPWIGYLVWDIQMCVRSYTNVCILIRSHHRVLAKFGSVLNTVEGLSYRSPRDIRLLGNPLKNMRTECVVRDTTTCGTRCSDVPPISSFSLFQEIFRIPADELDRAYREDIEALEE